MAKKKAKKKKATKKKATKKKAKKKRRWGSNLVKSLLALCVINLTPWWLNSSILSHWAKILTTRQAMQKWKILPMLNLPFLFVSTILNMVAVQCSHNNTVAYYQSSSCNRPSISYTICLSHVNIKTGFCKSFREKELWTILTTKTASCLLKT